MSPALRFVAGAGGVILLAVVGWFGFQALQHRAPAPTLSPPAAEAATTTTAAPDTAVMAAERERLQRERDDALAAARTAEQRLARERAARPAQSPAVGTWSAGSTWNNITLTADGNFSEAGGCNPCGTWTLRGSELTWIYTGSDNPWVGQLRGDRIEMTSSPNLTWRRQ